MSESAISYRELAPPMPPEEEGQPPLLAHLLVINDALAADNERLRVRARMRKRQRQRLAILCSLLASVGTWAVTAKAAGLAAERGGMTAPNHCRAQHVADCKHALSWWKKEARESEAAIEWQRKERLKLHRRLVAGGTSVRVSQLSRYDSWVCIHGHEGAWNDSGDPYWGGLQMDRSFMATYGADMIRRHGGGLADTWTPAEQIVVAERAYATRGFTPWPNTARMCGLL